MNCLLPGCEVGSQYDVMQPMWRINANACAHVGIELAIESIVTSRSQDALHVCVVLVQ